MGCDIHLWVERLLDGKWTAIGSSSHWMMVPPRGEDDLDDEVLESGDDFGAKMKANQFNELGNRNYDLFAILADVRNGYGFAGVDTGDGFIPIDQPRGIPEDASDLVKQWVKHWDIDGHSHSWFTVQDVLDYDYTQTTKHRGWVNAHEYQSYLDNGRPNSWCGGISGSAIEHIDNEIMEAMLKTLGLESREIGKYYTLLEWEETYLKSIDHWLNKLKEVTEPTDRIVFFFDN